MQKSSEEMNSSCSSFDKLPCVECRLGQKHECSESDSVKVKPFSCVLCNKNFTTKEDLQSHFRGHASDLKLKKKIKTFKPGAIKCDVCDETFALSNQAIQHKFKQHPEAKEKFFCPTCGKSFTLKSLLDIHYSSHQNETSLNKLECNECPAVFDNSSALTYHIDVTHKRAKKFYQPVETAPPSKKIRVNNAGDIQSVYFCHICGSQYIVKFNLQKHLEAFHTIEERQAQPTELVRCTACDALFYNRKAYENHKVGHSPDDLYVVDEQQRLKMVSRVDQDFDVRRIQTIAEKYVPSQKRISRKWTTNTAGKFLLTGTENFSPPSSPDPSDDEESEKDSPEKLTNHSLVS